jgi:hypothetical protein
MKKQTPKHQNNQNKTKQNKTNFNTFSSNLHKGEPISHSQILDRANFGESGAELRFRHAGIRQIANVHALIR